MAERDIRAEILKEIAERAKWYTPEWRLDLASPDAGAALALIWADMLAGTARRFARLPENYHRELLNALGAEPLPAVRAKGWLAFKVRGDAEEEQQLIIPAGTVVSAPLDPDAALVTEHTITASSSEITAIYCVIPERDAVCRYDGLADLELFRVTESGTHIWTFTHEFAFNVSKDATLSVVPCLNGGDIDALGVLASSKWEYQDSDGGDGGDGEPCWRQMGVLRDGNVLLCDFPGKENNCNAIRVTLAREDIKATELVSLTVKLSGKSLFSDALYANDTQEQDEESFFPFDKRFLPGYCAYFANSDALGKPGACVSLSFTLSYEEFEIEGYSQAEIQMKRRFMRVSELEPPKRLEATAAEVKWEYFNGVGWAGLNVRNNENAASIFNGTMNGRMKIEFDCPPDIKAAVVGAHDTPFIRARLIAADNLFSRHGSFKSPKLSNVRFGYRLHADITDIYVEEHMDGYAAKLPRPLTAQPEGTAAAYFAFNRELAKGTVLFDVEDSGQPLPLRWEYLTESGFVPLSVRDDTVLLSKTGVLSYQTTADIPAVKSRLWGQDAYWIRLAADTKGVDGSLSRTIKLKGLYENAVCAVARSAGEASNLPANSFTTLLSPVAGVTAAFNPRNTHGGACAEDEGRIINRLNKRFSHHGRAVSPCGYEALAMEASVRVAKARYYASTDEHGDYAYGSACLALLPHKQAYEDSFDELCDCVRAFIEPKMALGAGKLHIIPPKYVAVNVFVKVAVESADKASPLTIKNQINEALEGLLAPINWEIGQLPAPSRIDAEIRAVKGVSYIEKSKVSYSVDARHIAVDYKRAANEPFVLPVNGRHEIIVDY